MRRSDPGSQKRSCDGRARHPARATPTARGVPSVAAPVAFTWNPAGASPALGGGEFTADTLSTTGFLTDVGQLDGSGVTHQISVVNGFRLGGAQVTPSGFGTSYGLYLEFFDT